jgi:hypothetical protein
MIMNDIAEKLKKLREPFPTNQISKLPKPTKAQTDEVKADYKKGVRCKECGQWHHPQVVHLDYVGHAALTDRLLDVDPTWTWEPLAYDQNGTPFLDKDSGMWIKLTVLGVTRLGYGDAQGKIGGDAMKERIGDALRNAAMRFGCALDLWHKGDLHLDDTEPKPTQKPPQTIDYSVGLKLAKNLQELGEAWKLIPKDQQKTFFELKEKRKQQLTLAVEKPKTDTDWQQLISDATTKEEVNAIWESMPEELRQDIQDAYAIKMDLFR